MKQTSSSLFIYLFIYLFVVVVALFFLVLFVQNLLLRNTTVSVAILCLAVCTNDVINEAACMTKLSNMHHEPSLFCSSLARSSLKTDLRSVFV